MFFGRMGGVTSVRPSAALRVEFGGGVSARYFPVPIGDGACWFPFSVGRSAAKVPSHCVVVQGGTGVRVAVSNDVASRVLPSRTFSCEEGRVRVAVSLVLPCLIGGAFYHHGVEVFGDVFQ